METILNISLVTGITAVSLLTITLIGIAIGKIRV